MANFKKFMSGTLATLILVGMLANGISAKEFEDVANDSKYSEQIGILSDIGIIKGTSETEFSPDELVTREQMALLLFRLMIANDNAGPVNSTAFTDLYDDTYSGAISWANASGFILGTSETTFEPTKGITLQDAMTMLVRALGHGSAQMNAGYPWTFIDQAVKLGLDNGLEDISYTKELTRAEVAAFLYNALTAEYLIPKTAANGMTFYESTTIIEKVFNYKIDDCVIVATNNYAIDGVDTVTKTGYVTVKTEDALLTVNFSELGLEGTADENLGENIRMVYKVDEKTKLVSVLGGTELGKFSNPETIEVGKDDSYILIDGVKYQVVETLSDSLSTNANELLVYSYDEDGTLTQITSNADLSALLGAFDAKLIFDEKASNTADRLIIKSYKFDKLQIKGGKVNIAGNLEESKLEIVNPDNAKNGDYVLYYFNEDKSLLEIKSALELTDSELVSRITSTTATIGGVKYTLGNEKLGVSASSIKELLTVGEKVRVAVHDGCILAVDSSSTSIFAASQYLIAESDTTPAFVNGKFTYVMEATIDGETRTIFVTNESVEEGKVYRYIMDANDNYTLIPYTESSQVIESGDDKFVQSNSQNDEIAYIIEETDSTTIESSGSHYTLAKGSATGMSSTGLKEESINFITDKNTLIIAKSEGKYTIFRGVYSSDFTIEDSASVTAIFTNEAGTVETLRFLYISDGTLGTVGSGANSVKILENTGSEYINGNVYTIYSVLNLATGEVSTMMSLDSELTVGTNYLTNVDGTISSSEADVTEGVITGFTGTTISIGGETYTLDSNVNISVLNDDNTTDSASLSDAYMKNVEIVTENDKVTSIIILRDPAFTASCESTTLTVTSEDTIKEITNVELIKLIQVMEEGEDVEIDIEGYEAEAEDSSGYEITITCDEELQAGDYVLTFALDGVEFTVEFTVSE